MEKCYNNQGRLSGVEFLKIIAIFLIVVSHTVQTLHSYMPDNDYAMRLERATADVSHFILSLLLYCGQLGNCIFFVCSAWFLLDSKKVKLKKELFMILEIWTVSVFFLIVSLPIMGKDIDIKFIITSFMPTTFSVYWYLTCYILFYPIHTTLNKIIYSMSQKQLLTVSGIMFILYCCFNFIVGDKFCSSHLIIWVTLYFTLGYIKLYLKDYVKNLKVNYLFLIIGIIGNIGIVFLTNFLGLHIDFFSDQLLHWSHYRSPFLILIAVSALNIANHVVFVNKFINRISGFSLLVFIIHQSTIFKTYLRPLIFIYIHDKFGYDYILLWALAVAACIFLASVFIAWLYTESLQKLVLKVTDKLYILLSKIYNTITEKLMLIH